MTRPTLTLKTKVAVLPPAEVPRAPGCVVVKPAPRPASRKPVAAAWGVPVLDYLAGIYPDVIAQRGGPFRPLKRGIHNDVFAILSDHVAFADRTLQALRNEVYGALKLYCGRGPYLKVLRNGAARFDLNGVPCGTVTADEAADAVSRRRATLRRKPTQNPETSHAPVPRERRDRRRQTSPDAGHPA